MNFDNIKNAEKYYNLGERFQKGFEFLKNTDLFDLDNGKYEIDGEKIFVSVQDYNTKPLSEGKFEAHKKYADIQYIIKGSEKLGHTKVETLVPLGKYDENADITFFESDVKFEFVKADEGDFVIFMPEDAHMPCIALCEPSYVKKAVVKVLL